MAVDHFSRPALLEMQRDGNRAPRTKSWPPAGYVAPTDAEFTELLHLAEQYVTVQAHHVDWSGLSDEQILRRAQLCELTGQVAGAAYDYAWALRLEMSRRDITFQSLAILRCEDCATGTERLFEATRETHPDLSDKSNRPVANAWFCVRCWSGHTLGDIADGLVDEDEAEDEE